MFPQVFALLYLYHRIPTLFLVSFLWYKDDVRIVSKNPCGFSSNSRSDVQNAPDTTYFLASLGLLAPYLERACFLLATPAVSRVPRMMWYLVPGRSQHDHHGSKQRCAPADCDLHRECSRNFDSVGKTYSGDLSKSRVRLFFRSCCLNSSTYTTLLGSRNVCCFSCEESCNPSGEQVVDFLTEV